MTNKTYNAIWNNIVLCIYENIKNDDVNIYLSNKAKERVFVHYIKIREDVKKRYMEDCEEKLDRHKIAAIMMKAIVEVYPIKISKRHIMNLWRKKQNLEKEFVYANETLAFYTALSILENYKEYGIDGTVENKRKTIVMPETFNNSNYAMNTCIDLYYAKRNKNINVLTFSNVFFLLEKMAILNEIKVD